MTREAELEAEVAALRSILRPPVLFRPEWGLTKFQGRLLAVLIERDIVTFEQAVVAVGSDSPADPENTIRTMVSYMRPKLQKAGIEILSVRGVGYYLDPASREKAKAGLIASGHDVAN